MPPDEQARAAIVWWGIVRAGPRGQPMARVSGRRSVVSEIPAQIVHECGLTSLEPVGGGSVARTYRGRTPHGPVFVKTLTDPAPGFFDREAAGLAALRAAGGPPVPRLLYQHPAGLVLEWIDPIAAAGHTAGDEDFGRQLAHLHTHTGVSFGAVDDTPTGFAGSIPLDLAPSATWAQSYLQGRVQPWAARAQARGLLPAGTSRQVDALIARPEVCGPPEPPTLIHGDLWPGNRLVAADGRSWLIDPSAQYGHRELDLAVLRLFGGVSARVFTAYQEVFPLAPDWEYRIPLHQLAILLVHVLLFGPGYSRKVLRALAALQ